MSVASKANFCTLLCCLPLLLTAMSAARAQSELAAEVYMADEHESAWHFKGASALCELSHEIPQFGLARFQRLAGEELKFRIDSYQPVPEKIEGTLREASPPWSRLPADTLEQLIVVEPGLQPIKLDRRPAGWLLSALAKGQIGSFDMLDWNDSRKQRRIRLSPVNFQQPYREFKQCLRELGKAGSVGAQGPAGISEVAEKIMKGEELRGTVVHFALDVDALDPGAKATLTELADYIRADSRITAVRVAGHADDQGAAPYNLRLSARRAKRVFDYLLQQGVDPRLLSRRHYGESRPKIRGRSEQARAANRRAEIELIR
jgi:outer membrane protein OmpA-like peptidoglycan-associated protein